MLVSLFDWLNQARDRVFYQISKHFEESVQLAEYLVKKWEKCYINPRSLPENWNVKRSWEADAIEYSQDELKN